MKRIFFLLFLLNSLLCVAQEPWKEHLDQALEAYQAKNYEEACRLAYIVLDEGGGDAIPAFYVILSECEMACGRGDKAKIAGLNAGKRGIPDGYYVAGMLCLDGAYFNATKDINSGLEYLSMAANMGHDDALYYLAVCYEGKYGVTKNSYEYFKCVQKMEEKGDVLALYNLGWCYQSGTGVAKNLIKAEEYFLKLVEKGVYLGYNQMGYSKAYQKKYAEAYRWFDNGIAEYNRRGASEYGWDWTIDNLYDSKGEILLMEGKYEEAMPIYNRLKLSKDDKIQESAFIKKMQAYLADGVDKVLVTNARDNNAYALIIANENYMRVDNVSYALDDGRTFKEYCIKTLGVPSEHIVYISDASRNDLVYSIAQIKRLVASNNQAKLFVYYAGHGIPDEASRTAYLLPVDGYGTDVSTGYSIDMLYKELGELTSENIVFLDACFSGAKREGGMLAEARGVAIKVKPGTPQGNTVVFSAAQGDETALPYHEKYHGMFTYFLLKKIKETKGNVTLRDLSDYIITNVSRNSVDVNSKPQTPTTISSSRISGEWQNWNLK